ncbi:ornithine cyclodeaminase family protein [Cytobacillus firmus]|uniref:ornithine cyclodeaminase family protein n=1 Tax=Cytobacillus firmus TaxID=1399 RepID=UPI00367AB48C
MLPFRVLNQENIKEILDMRNVITLVEQAYSLKEQKEASLFPMVFHEFEPGKADMDIKSGELSGANIFGLKLVSWFGENPSKNLPSVIGTVLVLDSRTGAPLGILSGEYITMMRTGAAGGIGAKYLARKDSEELLLVGSGHLGPYQILATLMVMENIKRITVYNANSLDRAKEFCRSVKDKLFTLLEPYKEHDQAFYNQMIQRIDIPISAAEDIKQAAKKADIIITATPARKPIIKKEWVQPGTHISCVGADMEGKQEIDEQLFDGTRVFVDDVNQAITVGETEIPYKKGVISENGIVAELGSVILGEVQGRVSDQDITVFDSTGISLQDLLTASYILEQAEEKQIGFVTKL